MEKLFYESDIRPSTADLCAPDDRGARAGRRGIGRVILTGLIALSLITAPSMVLAENTSAGDMSKEGGLGAASALTSLIYGPVKLIYAVGGLIVGGCAWAFTAGDSQVAKTVFTRSLRGHYVITPEILTGEERLEFIGRDEAGPRAPVAAVASAPPIDQSYEDPEYDEMGW